jgi:hypothetical protein
LRAIIHIPPAVGSQLEHCRHIGAKVIGFIEVEEVCY